MPGRCRHSKRRGCNLQRRNLEPSQRAAIALDVKDRLREEYRERSLANLKRGRDRQGSRVDKIVNSESSARHEAAAMMQVSQGYVSDADRIRRADPEVFEAVKAGEMTIPEAKRAIAGKAP